MEFFQGSVDPGVEEEINAIIENATMTKGKEGYINGSLRQLSSNSFLKPFLCIGILFWCYNISGYGVITSYSNDYFDNAGAQAFSYETESVILGSVRWILTFLAPFILLKLPKKWLFVICGLVSSVGFILGDCYIVCSMKVHLQELIIDTHSLWKKFIDLFLN